MNEMDEYGVEEALRIKEAHGGEVTILTMGPESAVETIRKALSMGADKAVHLSDDALHGSDAIQTSAALAKVIETPRVRPRRSAAPRPPTPAAAVMGALLSERLGLPQLTWRRKVTVDRTARRSPSSARPRTATTSSRPRCPPSWASSRRSTSRATPRSRGSWPPRRSRSTTLRRADAGIDAAPGRTGHHRRRRSRSSDGPPRQAGQIVKDEGDGGAKVAEFLASQKLI